MGFTMQMPHLCVKCGKNPPDFAYTIQQKRTDFSLLTIITIFIGIIATESRTITIRVPMCDACPQQMSRQKWQGGMLFLAGVLMMIAGLWFITLSPAKFSILPFLSNIGSYFNIPTQGIAFLGMLFLGMIVIFIGVRTGRERLVSTNGETFRFYNKEFQEAFAELNPHLVKKSRWGKNTLAD
jgi:hypothetical protein